MPGLLDFLPELLNSDGGQLSMQMLANAAPRPGGGNFGVGLLDSIGGFNQFKQQQVAQQRAARDAAMREQLQTAQIGEINAQAQERQAQAAKMQAAQAEALKQRELLRQAFGGGGVAPIDANAASGVTGPRPEALGTVGQQRPVNFQALIAGGTPPELVKALAEAPNLGRQKVSRFEESMVNGAPVRQGFDDYGSPVGAALPQWKAPVFQDNGGQNVALDPITLKQLASFAKTNSPDALLSSSTARRGQDMTDARSREQNTLTRQNAGQLVDTPDGYVRVGLDNGTTPVMGPDGKPLLGKRSNQALTDTQAKALLFGTRMQESNAVLDKMAERGVMRPSVLAGAAGDIPVIGGAAGAAGNALFASADQQQVEQAQRDFINATLRRESGAAIATSEFDSARKQYFPQFGDSPEVIAQKRRNRDLATRGILAEVPQGRTLPSGGPAARVSSDADYNALPSGTTFVGPDGVTRRKP